MDGVEFTEHDCLRISIENAIDELQDLRVSYIPESYPWNILLEAERLMKLRLDDLGTKK